MDNIDRGYGKCEKVPRKVREICCQKRVVTLYVETG